MHLLKVFLDDTSSITSDENKVFMNDTSSMTPDDSQVHSMFLWLDHVIGWHRTSFSLMSRNLFIMKAKMAGTEIMQTTQINPP